MWKTPFCLIAGCVILACTSALHAAQTIVQHSGSNDPVTEGWDNSNKSNFMASSLRATIQTAPITNDAGTGKDAWSISLSNLKQLPDFDYYASNAWKQQVQDLANNGWVFTANCRIASIAPNTAVDFLLDIFVPQGSPNPALNSGYELMLYCNAQGELHPFFGGFQGSKSFFTLANPNDYHQYQVVFDPATQTANLSVDGTTVLANVAPAGSIGLLDWGVTSFQTSTPSTLTTQVNFNQVRFDVVPEPASIILAAIAGAGLAYLSKCRTPC